MVDANAVSGLPVYIDGADEVTRAGAMIRARAEVEALTPYVAPLEGRRPMLRLDFNESTATR